MNFTTSRATVPPRPPTPHEIAVAAYELYQINGCHPHHELEDWLAAERQLFDHFEKLKGEFDRVNQRFPVSEDGKPPDSMVLGQPPPAPVIYP
jgi:hypothetical protein